MNLSLDCSYPASAIQSKPAKVIQAFMNEFSVTDPWHFFNPDKREYSFLSHIHHTYTQIDFFLVNNKLLPSISGCKYDPIVISEHVSPSMHLYFQKYINSRPPWCLDMHFLLETDFIKFISDQLEFFFQVNTTPEVTALVLWETMKAFIRGEIISYKVHRLKSMRENLAELSQCIAFLDSSYAQNCQTSTRSE